LARIVVAPLGVVERELGGKPRHLSLFPQVARPGAIALA